MVEPTTDLILVSKFQLKLQVARKINECKIITPHDTHIFFVSFEKSWKEMKIERHDQLTAEEFWNRTKAMI